jgi:uncharacterized protein
MVPLHPDDPKCLMAVVKIAGRCNINCTYCYMYNLGDSTSMLQPKKMSDETVIQLMQRVKEHCQRHAIERFTFVLHGGEPLLAGKEFFRFFVASARQYLAPHTRPLFGLQTNGMLLDEDWCTLLGELGISIGVSIDGTKEAHDMYRLDFKGEGTYDRVIAGLHIAQQSKALAHPPGVLCVQNIDADPIGVYEAFKALGVPDADFLMPDHTHDTPPPAQHYQKSPHPYADWLIQIFDRWFAETETPIRIRFFEFIVGTVLGGNYEFDSLGFNKNELLVIETNGSIEALDVLKACGDGFTKNGAHVATHSFDDAMQTDLARLYHYSHQQLPRQCSVCPVREICGGGYVPHRYSSRNGFNNPSVYCHDLLKLITHIQNAVIDALPPDIAAETELDKITYEEARAIINTELQYAVNPDYTVELESFKQ